MMLPPQHQLRTLRRMLYHQAALCRLLIQARPVPLSCFLIFLKASFPSHVVATP